MAIEKRMEVSQGHSVVKARSTRVTRAKSSRGGAISTPPAGLDIELLLFFHSVAETLSFTKAAQKLGIDQSWLSHKIRQLEGALNLSLFIRNTRNVELTRAGLTLLEPTRKLAEFAEQARASAEMLSACMTGALRVGALPFSFPDPMRTSLLDKFMSSHPDIQIVVSNGSTPTLLDSVRSGKADLAFVSAPFDDAGLDKLLLRENQFCLLVPEEHVLASLPDLDAASLSGHSIIMPAAHFSPATFEAYYKPLIDAGVVPISVPEFQSAVSYALDGRLPVACTQFAGERDCKPGLVVRLLSFIPPCKKYLVRLSSHRTPSQAMLWDLAATR